jgi:uncharacterized protein GlcG (DUF336 family)
VIKKLGSRFAVGEVSAATEGLAVAIAAVDAHGNTVLMSKMDGAPAFAVHMATQKAYTAIAMNTATSELTSLVQPGEPLFGLIEASGGRLLPFGGGAVLTLDDGDRYGIGVSGGTTEQDMAILGHVIDGK